MHPEILQRGARLHDTVVSFFYIRVVLVVLATTWPSLIQIELFKILGKLYF